MQTMSYEQYVVKKAEWEAQARVLTNLREKANDYAVNVLGLGKRQYRTLAAGNWVVIQVFEPANPGPGMRIVREIIATEGGINDPLGPDHA